MSVIYFNLYKCQTVNPPSKKKLFDSLTLAEILCSETTSKILPCK